MSISSIRIVTSSLALASISFLGLLPITALPLTMAADDGQLRVKRLREGGEEDGLGVELMFGPNTSDGGQEGREEMEGGLGCRGPPRVLVLHLSQPLLHDVRRHAKPGDEGLDTGRTQVDLLQDQAPLLDEDGGQPWDSIPLGLGLVLPMMALIEASRSASRTKMRVRKSRSGPALAPWRCSAGSRMASAERSSSSFPMRE
jgi:hypothetical protein